MKFFKRTPVVERKESIISTDEDDLEPNKPKSFVTKGFKGTDKNMQCRGYQYGMEQTFVHDESAIKLCNSGFHFCKNLNDVHVFYSFYDDKNRFFEIEAYGPIIEDENKQVTASIRFIRELSRNEVVKAIDSRYEIIEDENHNVISKIVPFQHGNDGIESSSYTYDDQNRVLTASTELMRRFGESAYKKYENIYSYTGGETTKITIGVDYKTVKVTDTLGNSDIKIYRLNNETVKVTDTLGNSSDIKIYRLNDENDYVLQEHNSIVINENGKIETKYDLDKKQKFETHFDIDRKIIEYHEYLKNINNWPFNKNIVNLNLTRIKNKNRLMKFKLYEYSYVDSPETVKTIEFKFTFSTKRDDTIPHLFSFNSSEYRSGKYYIDIIIDGVLYSSIDEFYKAMIINNFGYDFRNLDSAIGFDFKFLFNDLIKNLKGVVENPISQNANMLVNFHSLGLLNYHNNGLFSVSKKGYDMLILAHVIKKYQDA